jgi:hypothetical protein
MLKKPDPAKAATDDFYAIIEDVGGRAYASLIRRHVAAELDIVFLRQQARGQLLGEGGDIDNRLKTLFDALRMPSKGEVNTLGNYTAADEQPLHCLLRDDSLIYRVNVESDRLLRVSAPGHLVVVINVNVIVTKTTFTTLGLSSN